MVQLSQPTNYLVASQRPWGVRVFSRLADTPAWCLVETAGDLAVQISERQPRYVFFLHWSSRVSSDELASAECVNFHCTALPYGRGGGPIENLIVRGHTETVMTAHRMIEEIDAGPIYGQRGPISLAGTKEDILNRFIEPCQSLVQWIVETNPTPKPQVGEVVRFSRLPEAQYNALWRTR